MYPALLVPLGFQKRIYGLSSTPVSALPPTPHLGEPNPDIILRLSDNPPDVLEETEETESVKLLCHILSENLPCQERWRSLLAHVHQEPNAYLSVSHSQFPNWNFPLWLLTFLDSASRYSCDSSVEDWRKSLSWLESLQEACMVDAHLRELRSQALLHLQVFPYNETMRDIYEEKSTSDLQFLVGDRWINNFIIDAACHLVNRITAQHGSRTFALPITRCTAIIDAFSDVPSHKGAVEVLKLETDLEREARDGRVHALFMPLHINGNHFVVMKVGFEERLLTYSDSKSPSLPHCPKQTLVAIKGWLSSVSAMSGWNYHAKEISLPYQDDSTSCGIIVISTIAARILGHEDWSNKTRFHHRLAWFLWITHPNEEPELVRMLFDAKLREVEMLYLKARRKNRAIHTVIAASGREVPINKAWPCCPHAARLKMNIGTIERAIKKFQEGLQEGVLNQGEH
ncbi:uncharacterized protein EI90DRAFT_3152355 [Cantharellus anzutake]|uniref:uncharacterized protein n=1 Tax=Cantharellus anzutake TaxID=1750568 RepID=UPI001906AFF6|nr:uncharacterized protein EI90DRAFT_3152355 [Cantharellus anzutake]KAF8336933.1 hypothetical protein EI90DRAFT_3152355 [Cantharellus anzutake]